MPRLALICTLTAGLGLALAGTASAGNGVCTLSFDVSFDQAGTIVPTRPGEAVCAGTVGATGVDPSPARASISGYARPGATSCAPVLAEGRLAIDLLRLISFDPRRDVHVDGQWGGSGLPAVTVVTGTGRADGLTMPFAGAARFIPAAGACTLGGFSPGTIQMELVIGEARRASVARSRIHRRAARSRR